MMVTQASELYSKIKVDNSLVLKFLTSTASAMSEHQILDQKELNGIRIMLSGTQGSQEESEKHILNSILKQDDFFMELLLRRFGARRIYHNLSYLTLRQILMDTSLQIADLSNQLLEKSKLFYNRTFYLFQNEQSHRQTLFSSFLIDVTEMLCESNDHLQDIIRDQMDMLPHGLTDESHAEYALDEDIAAELGFSSVKDLSLPMQRETKHILQYQAAITTVCEVCREVMVQLCSQKNGQDYSDDLASTISFVEDISSELYRMSLSKIPNSDSLEPWEYRRQTVLKSMIKINVALMQIKDQIIGFIGKMGLNNENSPTIPVCVSNRMIYQMMIKGVQQSEAKQAASDFIQYVRNHDIEPKDMISGELQKINGNLTEDIIKTLETSWPKKGSIKMDLKQKEYSYKKFQEIQGKLTKFMKEKGTLVSLIIVCLSFLGCGVKKDPQSDVVEFDRAIPFKEDVLRLSNSESNKTKNQKARKGKKK